MWERIKSKAMCWLGRCIRHVEGYSSQVSSGAVELCRIERCQSCGKGRASIRWLGRQDIPVRWIDLAPGETVANEAGTWKVHKRGEGR